MTVGGKVKSKHKKKKKPKLTPEQRAQKKLKASHIRGVRRSLDDMGFDRIPELAEKQFKYKGQDGELDDAFLRENVILLVEYTVSQSADVKDHLKNKKITYDNIEADPAEFIDFLKAKYPTFANRFVDGFHRDKYIVRLVYCSRNDFGADVKDLIPFPVYLDYPYLKYFEKISASIKLSALSEFLQFLRIDPISVAVGGKFQAKSASVEYPGSLLPESASGYPKGYKVVSFYADAAALLARAYVLRRDGWRSTFQAYQRMVQPAKIESIRKRLRGDRRVFVNNLIATLPGNVHPVDSEGKTVDIAKLTETEPVRIALPLLPNSIGLIDGQHRLFSYYESRDDDPDIAKLRGEQNLLVTGIIYPPGVKAPDRERFEASLFLSINTNQTNAPTALRQEIEVVLNPSSPTAIGKQVMQRLAASGPLSGHVESRFFDKGLLKTTSIVSYGLGPLIKLQGDDSLFRLFQHEHKDSVAEGGEPLDAYLQFCASSINMFINAARANIDADRWTSDRSKKDRVISVTAINSFLIAMRHIISSGGTIDFSDLRKRLNGINNFPFSSYHSSQYSRMAAKIYADYLA